MESYNVLLLFNSLAILLQCVENWIEKRHPEFKKICHQPVYFVDEQVKLIPGDVDGWDVDTDKEVRKL